AEWLLRVRMDVAGIDHLRGPGERERHRPVGHRARVHGHGAAVVDGRAGLAGRQQARGHVGRGMGGLENLHGADVVHLGRATAAGGVGIDAHRPVGAGRLDVPAVDDADDAPGPAAAGLDTGRQHAAAVEAFAAEAVAGDDVARVVHGDIAVTLRKDTGGVVALRFDPAAVVDRDVPVDGAGMDAERIAAIGVKGAFVGDRRTRVALRLEGGTPGGGVCGDVAVVVGRHFVAGGEHAVGEAVVGIHGDVGQVVDRRVVVAPVDVHADQVAGADFDDGRVDFQRHARLGGDDRRVVDHAGFPGERGATAG